MGAGRGGAASPYLSVDPERAALLLQLDGRDAGHLPRLLDVGAVGADGEAHQVLADLDLLLVRRRQLLARLGLDGGGGDGSASVTGKETPPSPTTQKNKL